MVWETFVGENNLEDGKMLNFIYDCSRTFIGGCSEYIDFPQVSIDVDVDDYGTGEEEED